jgi:hypothetical protein
MTSADATSCTATRTSVFGADFSAEQPLTENSRKQLNPNASQGWRTSLGFKDRDFPATGPNQHRNIAQELFINEKATAQ